MLEPSSSSPQKSPSWPDRVALAMCGLLGAGFLILLYVKYHSFGYYDWDLALYAQAVWALGQGQLTSSLFATSFLTNHSEFIAFVIAPIMKIFPSAFTMITLKVLAFSAGAYLFYRVASRMIGPGPGLWLMGLYLIYPANLYMILYEFHFDNLAIPLIFLLYYFYFHSRSFTGFVLCAFTMTLIKENICLIPIAFGLFALLDRSQNNKKWAWAGILIGGGVFVFSQFLLTPFLRSYWGLEGANQYLSLYLGSGENTSILSKALATLSLYWDNLTGPLNQNYIKELFLPLGFIPLLSPQILFLGFPIFLQHFLSSSPQNHQIIYHYAATVAPFIFLAAARTLRIFRASENKRLFGYSAILITAASIAFLAAHYPALVIRVQDWNDPRNPYKEILSRSIPADAKVVASFDFLAPMSAREGLYSLHTLWRGVEPFTWKQPFVLPDDVSVSLIDWECAWAKQDILFSDSEHSRKILDRLGTLYFNGSWETLVSADSIELAHRKNVLKMNPRDRLVRRTLRDPSERMAIASETTKSPLGLIRTQAKLSPHKEFGFKTIDLRTSWRVSAPTEDIYSYEVHLLKNDQIVLSRSHWIGYIIYPTSVWTENEIVEDLFRITIPEHLKPGTYRLALNIINVSQGRIMRFQAEAGEAVTLGLGDLIIPQDQ